MFSIGHQLLKASMRPVGPSELSPVSCDAEPASFVGSLQLLQVLLFPGSSKLFKPQQSNVWNAFFFIVAKS